MGWKGEKSAKGKSCCSGVAGSCLTFLCHDLRPFEFEIITSTTAVIRTSNEYNLSSVNDQSAAPSELSTWRVARLLPLIPGLCRRC